jgi:putative transposase
MTAICAVLGLARRSAYYVARARPDGRHHRAADGTVLQQIRAVTNSRATYGYRRVWAMVNRTFRTGYNRKRIRRVMQLHGLMLAPRVHRRHGRPHLGQIQQPASNQRWCSDVFLIPCWSGEVLSVAFAIDCHDREVPAFVASPRSLTGADIRTLMDRTLWARFGEATLKAPHAIQWLSDNGPQYTATATVLYAHELGLVPITTPAYSPESNGLAEAFVGTFKRDYLGDAELRDAETVLAQLGGWFDDYNTLAPHSALGMRSPREYRALTVASACGASPVSETPPHLPQDGRSPEGALSGYPPKIGIEPTRASS